MFCHIYPLFAHPWNSPDQLRLGLGAEGTVSALEGPVFAVDQEVCPEVSPGATRKQAVRLLTFELFS